MNGETRLIDTNVLVHAYTIADDRKHQAALALVERVWAGEEVTTTLQNVCEFFFVVTRKGLQAYFRFRGGSSHPGNSRRLTVENYRPQPGDRFEGYCDGKALSRQVLGRSYRRLHAGA